MRQIVLVLFLILFCFKMTAQKKVVTLHPEVGDTIDKVELAKYFLFTEYSQDSLDYIMLTEDNNLYFLCGYSNNARIFKDQVSEDEMLLQKENIEKLSKYFTTVNVQDSVHINLKNDSILLNNQVNLDFNTPEFHKNIKKENRRNFWQEKREETKRHQQKGIHFY